MLQRNTAGRVLAATVRRALAEHDGWRVEFDKPGKWLLRQPRVMIGGTICHVCIANGFTESNAWQFAPNYPTDYNAAMGLLESTEGIEFSVSRRMVSVWEDGNPSNRVLVGGAAGKLPLAICLAVLAYWGIDDLKVEDIE